MFEKTFRYAIYVAVIAVILSLSGIFGSFEGRQVIRGRLTLDTVVLVLMLGSAGYLAGSSARSRGRAALWISAIVGSLIVGAILALLVLIEASIDLRFIFPNLNNPIYDSLTFGQELTPGLLTLLGISVGVGALAALLLTLPKRLRDPLVVSFGLTIVIGLLESQIRGIITLPDALAVALAFALGYAANLILKTGSLPFTLLISAIPGAVLGIVFALLIDGGALAPGGILRGTGSMPSILSLSPGAALIPLAVVFAFVSVAGGLARRASRTFHNGMIQFIVSLLVIGVLNWQGAMNDLATVLTYALLFAAFMLTPPLGESVQSEFEALTRPQQRVSNRAAGVILLLLLIVAPAFMGQYITNVINLVGLYIIMGIGLNIVVGYAGLLDLGYVAFFAIGAYAIGLLTTPSLLTCGGIAPRQLTPDTVGELCTGIMTFWEAWPVAILFSALAGILLGIPILRLRGDYLAIVTLGFGEIIRLLVRFDDFKDLLGAAQGVNNIPRPIIDLSSINPGWVFPLTSESGIYYLVLAGIVIVALISARLANSRLGRSWMAMRADEDVAQAMGVNLVRTKLLAFAIGAAFAGMGGAVAGTRLYGAYPDSFTILVSINVLSLIIIGGLGSIPGVIVGSLVLVGLPEVLRELSDYRLLAFGSLLVVAMLLKPQGLIPPTIRQLTEVAREHGEYFKRKVS